MKEYLNSIKGKKLKRILIPILVLILIIASTVAICLLSDDMKSSDFGMSNKVEYTGGNATSGQTYTISSADSLRALANAVNGGQDMAGVTFELTKDIDLNPGITIKADGTYTGGTPKAWTPIGNISNRFKGTFDGKFHEIKGIYTYNDSLGSSHQGLFGYSQNATIKNVGAVDGYIKGYSSVGGVVGTATFTTIINCYNTNTVRARFSNGGGIVGQSLDSYVANCYNAGAIELLTGGNGDIGGIVGVNAGSSLGVYVCIVENCYNIGKVTGKAVSGYGIGGLVGKNSGTGTLTKNCYSLTGAASRVVGLNIDGAKYTNCPTFSAAAANFYGGSHTAVTVNAVSSSYIVTSLNLGAATIDGAMPWVVRAKSEYPVHAKELPDYTTNWLDGITAVTTTWDSGGTIGTAKELAQFSYNVLNGKNYSKQTIELTADINLGGKWWTSIGTVSTTASLHKPFSGIFDGKGYTIRNIYIDKPIATAPTENRYHGLFGYVKSGTVRNLGVLDGFIKGYAWVGGIVGRLEGSVENCYSTATVVANSSIGGIVGRMDSGKIINSYGAGLVSGNIHTGSVVGYMANGSLTYSYGFDVKVRGAGAVDANGAAIGTYSSVSLVTLDNQGGKLTTAVTISNFKTTKMLSALNRKRIDAYMTWAVDPEINNGMPYHKNDYPVGVNWLDGITSVSTTWDNGGVIKTAEELAQFSYNVKNNKNYLGVTITLGANIDLSAKQWTAIGYYTATTNRPFMGSFDGNGFAVKGIYINKTSTTDAHSYQGLFGYVKNGVVKNLGVVKAYIRGYNWVGGIAGRSENMTFDNCYTDGFIFGKTYVGGIAGWAKETIIQNCYNTSEIEGQDQLGGIIGNAETNTRIRNCYNSGDVTGVAGYIGGIIGNVETASCVQNCYNTGNVVGATVATTGGVAGQLTTSTTWIENSYWLANTCAVGIGTNKSTHLLMKIPVSFDSSLRLSATGVVNGVTVTNLHAAMNEGAKYFDVNLSRWMINPSVNSGYPVFSYTYANWLDGIYTVTADWDNGGTIYTAGQLAQFAFNVNSGKTYAGKTINLGANINLMGKQWTPIGNSVSRAFEGIFNGNGYTIKGITINSGNSNYIGLFGYVNNANIKDLSVTDGYIFGKQYIGGFVGYANNSRIENCNNTNAVVGDNSVGGIVGSSNGESIIINCYNGGSVTAFEFYGGGIIGYSAGQAQNCYNEGEVNGYQRIGGIAGDISTDKLVQNCYNTGMVNGSFNIGGIAGYSFGTVINCYNMGIVQSDGNFATGKVATGGETIYGIGGIVGYSLDSTISNSYNTGEVISVKVISVVYVGSIVGAIERAKVTNCYWLTGTAAKGIGSSTGTNITEFGGANGGTLTSSVTVNGVATNDLLTVLNAGRKLYAGTSLWAKDGQTNNGYPFLIPRALPQLSSNGNVDRDNNTVAYGYGTTITLTPPEDADWAEYSWDQAVWTKYTVAISIAIGSGTRELYIRSAYSGSTYSTVETWTLKEKTATDLTGDKVSFTGVQNINGENYYQRHKFSITITRPENAVNLKYMLYVDGSRPAEWKTLSFLSEDGNTINTTITLPFDNSIPHRSTIKIELQVGNSETYSGTILTYVFKEGSPELPQTVSSNA